MTTAQAITTFKILYDQYGSPYIPDAKIVELLNMGQWEVLNRMVPDSLGDGINFEFDSNTLKNVENLIFYVNRFATGSEVLYSDVISTLRFVSGDSQASIFRTAAVAVRETGATQNYARYVPWNKWYVQQKNTFKIPTVKEPIYTIGNTGAGKAFIFDPTPPDSIYFTVLKTPRTMAVGNSPDWDDYVMNQVIFQALKLAGVSVSDEKMISDLRNTGIQSAQ